MGKTGLIKHVFHKLKRKKNTQCIYFDMMPTTDIESFVKRFGMTFFEQSLSYSSKSLKIIKEIFSNLKISIAFDDITGSPSISISPDKKGDIYKTIDSIFYYIASEKNKFYFAFDEFQQVLNYSDDGLVALLRSHIQSLSNASFIFQEAKSIYLPQCFRITANHFIKAAI